MKRRMALILALIFAACATGCVNVQSEEYRSYREEVDSWSYPKKVCIVFKDLFLDLTDIVSFDGGLGEGFLAHAQVTKLAEAGAGYVHSMQFVFDRRAVGFARIVRKEGGLGPVYYRDLTFEPIQGTRTLTERPRSLQDYTIRHNELGHWADVGADAHVLFIGGGARVSPKEAMDAVGNLVSVPFNVLWRPVFGTIDLVGNLLTKPFRKDKPPLFSLSKLHPPEVDFSEDDTAAAIRRKYNVILIEQHPGFGPAETVNEWVHVPY